MWAPQAKLPMAEPSNHIKRPRRRSSACLAEIARAGECDLRQPRACASERDQHAIHKRDQRFRFAWLIVVRPWRLSSPRDTVPRGTVTVWPLPATLQLARVPKSVNFLSPCEVRVGGSQILQSVKIEGLFGSSPLAPSPAGPSDTALCYRDR